MFVCISLVFKIGRMDLAGILLEEPWIPYQLYPYPVDLPLPAPGCRLCCVTALEVPQELAPLELGAGRRMT